jgi:hypothetical protein
MSTSTHFAGVKKVVTEVNKQFLARTGKEASDRFIHFLCYAEGYKTFGDIANGAVVPDIALAALNLIAVINQKPAVSLYLERQAAFDLVKKLHHELPHDTLTDEQRKTLSTLKIVA